MATLTKTFPQPFPSGFHPLWQQCLLCLQLILTPLPLQSIKQAKKPPKPSYELFSQAIFLSQCLELFQITTVIKSVAFIVLNILSKSALTSLNGTWRTFAHLNDSNILRPASSRIHWKTKWNPFSVTWKGELFIETQKRSYSLPTWLSIQLKKCLDDHAPRDMVNMSPGGLCQVSASNWDLARASWL